MEPANGDLAVACAPPETHVGHPSARISAATRDKPNDSHAGFIQDRVHACKEDSMFKNQLRQLSLPLALSTWLVITSIPAHGQVVSFTVNGQNFASFGYSIATIGDIDQDGVRDVLVGEPGYASEDPALGRVSIYSGQTGALLRQQVGEIGDFLGWAVADA